MAHSLPKELRILIALAAAALLGGLLTGFTTPLVGATPAPSGPYVKPCVNIMTGEVSHGAVKCPAGTFAVDVTQAGKPLCVNMYNKKFFYRFSGKCGNGEMALPTDSSMEIWGCYNGWTGGLTWLPMKSSACSGQALPFETSSGCRIVSAPAATESFFGPPPLC